MEASKEVVLVGARGRGYTRCSFWLDLELVEGKGLVFEFPWKGYPNHHPGCSPTTFNSWGS